MTKFSAIRYERHLDLPNFGKEGQEKLLSANISIVGVGGLGSPVAIYLAAAGVGNITLIDDDKVSLSNLQRQIIFKNSDIDKDKIDAAKVNLLALNSSLNIVGHTKRINKDNIEELLYDSQYIIDCSDNFDTRYLLNHYVIKNNKTLISGSVIFFDGQVYVFKRNYACYSCLFPVQPTSIEVPTCNESAVLGPCVGVIGTLVSVEVIKEIASLGETLSGSFLNYSGLSSEVSKIQIKRNLDCEICGE